MTHEPGDIVLVPFPFSDLRSKKTRPALVLSLKSHNQRGELVVCAITSNLDNSAASVLIEPGDLLQGNLPKPSRVKAAKLATLSPSLVRRTFGRLRPAVMAQVWKEFDAVFPKHG